MGVPFEYARERFPDAANKLFGSDPRVRAVGIGRHDAAFGYTVVRNAAVILPLGAGINIELLEKAIDVPVTFHDSFQEPQRLVTLPHTGPGSPGTASVVPEQGLRRPLCSGLQIENFDDDIRTGKIAAGQIFVGSLGCFVTAANGHPAILSNNHVLAGENRGIRNNDRILQPGSPGVFSQTAFVGVLEDFVSLLTSPPGATPIAGTAVFNDIDAAIAEVDLAVAFVQGYLSMRTIMGPHGSAKAAANDLVSKVGRTTGLTHGKVISVGGIVGPIAYTIGECWFRNAITIEGVDGTLFSDLGDSGTAIVRPTGELVGILFAGNGTQSFACPIDLVLAALNCQVL